METILAIALGIGLSAACGFRVFVPLLGLSIAAKLGIVPLSSNFEWVSSYPAIIILSAATIAEIGAYYIPWLDNVLDSITSPAAVVAGILVTASVLVDMPSSMRWALAIIAGGGTAGVIQGATVLTRGASTTTTGGIANLVFSTLELIGSVIMTILSIVIPIVVAIVVLIVMAFLFRKIYRFLNKNKDVQYGTVKKI